MQSFRRKGARGHPNVVIDELADVYKRGSGQALTGSMGDLGQQEDFDVVSCKALLVVNWTRMVKGRIGTP